MEASFLYQCMQNAFVYNVSHLSKEHRFWEGGSISYIWYKNPSFSRVNLKKFSKIKSYITKTVQAEKLYEP